MRLAGGQPCDSALLLPHAWLLLLRLLIQIGVPPALLKACGPGAPVQGQRNTHAELFAAFPGFLQQAWAAVKDQLAPEEVSHLERIISKCPIADADRTTTYMSAKPTNMVPKCETGC